MEHQATDLQVEIAMLPIAQGGRKTPISSGYRPNHKHPLTGEFFMGELALNGSVAPGETAQAQVKVITSQSQLSGLRGFGSWTIWEGPHHIGSVRLIG